MCLWAVVAAMYDAFYLSKPEKTQGVPAGDRNRISLTSTSVRKRTCSASGRMPGVRGPWRLRPDWLRKTLLLKRPRPPGPVRPLYSRPENCPPSTEDSGSPDQGAFRARARPPRSSGAISPTISISKSTKFTSDMTSDIYPRLQVHDRGIFDSQRDGKLMYMNRGCIDRIAHQLRRGFMDMLVLMTTRELGAPSARPSTTSSATRTADQGPISEQARRRRLPGAARATSVS